MTVWKQICANEWEESWKVSNLFFKRLFPALPPVSLYFFVFFLQTSPSSSVSQCLLKPWDCCSSEYNEIIRSLAPHIFKAICRIGIFSLSGGTSSILFWAKPVKKWINGNLFFYIAHGLWNHCNFFMPGQSSSIDPPEVKTLQTSFLWRFFFILLLFQPNISPFCKNILISLLCSFSPLAKFSLPII